MAGVSDLNNYQFVHGLYRGAMPQSRLFECIIPVLDKLNVAAIIKIVSKSIPRFGILRGRLYSNGHKTPK